MAGAFLRYGNRTLLFLLEALAVIIVIAAIAIGAFVWRVAQGPMSIGFAKNYVESALSGGDENIRVTFDDMVVSWPELKGPFLLDLSGLRVALGEGDDNTLTMDRASVGLSRRALLVGYIRPVSVILREPSLELVRGADGRFNLSLQNNQIRERDAAQSAASPGERVATFYKDMARHTKGKFFARLNEFQIVNASVSIKDEQDGQYWQMSDFDFAMQEHRQGIASSLRARLPGVEGRNAGIEADLVYREKTDDFIGQASIRNVNPYVLSRLVPLPEDLMGQNLFLSGRGEAAFDTDLTPLDVRFEGNVPEGQISVPDQYDAPIDIRDVRIGTTYEAAKGSDGTVDVYKLSGTVAGIPFEGAGRARFDRNSLSLPLSIRVPAAELSQVTALFPRTERDGEAFEWMAEKIQGGSFSDVTLDMELSGSRMAAAQGAPAKWDYRLPRFMLGFAFKDASVAYNGSLMPAEKASGKGVLDLAAETLEITDGEASLGDIKGTGVNVLITHLMTGGAGHVTVKADVKGPLSTALDYIADDPIRMDQKEIGIDAAKVKGTLAAAIEVSLPTIRDVPKDQVVVNIKGTLDALELPDAVNGLALTGGPLAIATEPGGFRVKGSAKLDGRDTVLDWHQYFNSAGRDYSMRIAAQTAADADLRKKFGVDLDDYISGTLPLDVVYTRKGTDSKVEVKGDLTPVALSIKPFRFEKPAGKAGTIAATAVLKNDVLKELSGLTLQSSGLSVKNAKITFAPRGDKKADLDTGSLPDVTIGKTKLSATFDVDKNGVMEIKAKGPVFDLAPFLKETEASTRSAAVKSPAQKEKQTPLRIAVTADDMPAQNGASAKKARAYLETDADGDITRLEYDATIGKAPLLVRFSPDETGKRIFRLGTEDAGAVLKTFGLYEDIVGGRLIAYAEPKGGNLRGDLYGTMRMEGFRVVGAPALAKLLSLMSLTGVRDLLGNEGIVFEKLEAGFEWRFRPEGNLLIVKDGKTSGSSVGLTFAGFLDRGRKTTDIAGTIIPMSGIGAALAKVPVIGTLLGGAGGLIAATYKIEGPSSDPKVSINPLSVLAPGILRSILFEGGYENKIPGNDDAPKAQKPTAKVKEVPARQDDRTAAAR